jgi:predicted N-acetyltransferase YhbS
LSSAKNNDLSLVRAEPHHVDAIGRICFKAFRTIHDKHAFPRDFPTLDLAMKVISILVDREDFYGVVALIDSKPVGSNFLSLTDPVAGVGPITVDPASQTKGIGRALMEDVIDYARRNSIQRVRLLQDSFNMSSLSLYSSLGFDVKEPVVLMQAAPAPEPDESVRPVREADMPAIEELSKRIYKVSRSNEVASTVSIDLPAFLRTRGGQITGYLIPGFFGHGVAETEGDALALIAQSARRIPPELARFFCPLREGNLYRNALKAGHRAIKVMNLMAMGPYEPPDKTWMPSIAY